MITMSNWPEFIPGRHESRLISIEVELFQSDYTNLAVLFRYRDVFGKSALERTAEERDWISEYPKDIELACGVIVKNVHYITSMSDVIPPCTPRIDVGFGDTRHPVQKVKTEPARVTIWFKQYVRST